MTLPISEAALLNAVIELAHLRGWMVAHFRPAMTSKGWRTPLQGDAGVPDLILARGGTVILVELKSRRGVVTPAQRGWLDAAGGLVWRPEDWDTIERTLL